MYCDDISVFYGFLSLKSQKNGNLYPEGVPQTYRPTIERIMTVGYCVILWPNDTHTNVEYEYDSQE